MFDTRHTYHTTTNLPIQSRAQITSFTNDCDCPMVVKVDNILQK